MTQGHEQDHRWMGQALALAALGEGTTSPNPRVGCVLVRHGRVVGRGYHRACGEPHAEARALDEARAQAEGAVLYVNLEPCAHEGLTPPCCDRLIRQGVAEVVAAIGDPDPRVDGRGFAALREAGITVRTGVLQEQAARLNAPFLTWHRERRPFVTIKAAVTLDGRLSADQGVSRWISGPAARRFAHRLRFNHDAVLVGAGTVRADDPRLTVRLPGIEASRRRVVVSGSLDLGRSRRLASVEDGEPALVYSTRRAIAERGGALGVGVELVAVAADGASLELGAVLDDLGSRGVRSVLVEGGGKTIATFLRAGLADQAALVSAPRLVGGRGATPLFDAPAVSSPEAGWSFVLEQRMRLGDDELLLGRLERSAA